MYEAKSMDKNQHHQSTVSITGPWPRWLAVDFLAQKDLTENTVMIVRFNLK